ncbi:helix-turn-helix domain-containing protein [Micromonospora sp. DR5-3]|uniref:helix-turn-helix domain-containing protein n=1 Tax=unclassified Micromonospora TaxID=2617518 RepID=UPI001652A96B|nr:MULTISPECIES: helix-turn-helix domain-containing protein [unclassified Micromonospora]MCW3818617.1 helix-turn-helix domain-containing protein [Micromonospora sp. DR5-3]
MPSTRRPHVTTRGPATERRQSAWTADQVRALGLTTDLATAADILGVSRSAAYKLARRDAFPVPLIRAGTHYRVPVPPILAALHLAHDVPSTEDANPIQ